MTRNRHKRSSLNRPAETRSSRLRWVAAITRTSSGHAAGPSGSAGLRHHPATATARLHARAHVAGLVEKERSRCARRSLPRVSRPGAGGISIEVSEELQFESRFGEAGAVHRHEAACRRLDWQWIYRATRSFPTPLSPVIRTVADSCAARPPWRAVPSWHCWQRRSWSPGKHQDTMGTETKWIA